MEMPASTAKAMRDKNSRRVRATSPVCLRDRIGLIEFDFLCSLTPSSCNVSP